MIDVEQLNNDTRDHDFVLSSNQAKLDDDLAFQTTRNEGLHPNNFSGSNPGEERFRSETLGEAYNGTPNDSMLLEDPLKSRATEDVTPKPHVTEVATPKSRVTEDVTPKPRVTEGATPKSRVTEDVTPKSRVTKGVTPEDSIMMFFPNSQVRVESNSEIDAEQKGNTSIDHSMQSKRSVRSLASTAIFAGVSVAALGVAIQSDSSALTYTSLASAITFGAAGISGFLANIIATF